MENKYWTKKTLSTVCASSHDTMHCSMHTFTDTFTNDMLQNKL